MASRIQRVMVATVLLALALAALWFSTSSWDEFPFDASNAKVARATTDLAESGDSSHGALESSPADVRYRPPKGNDRESMLSRLREMAAGIGSGYRVKILSEIQTLDLLEQYAVLEALWVEGHGELAAPLLDIALTCAAHGNVVAGVGPEAATRAGHPEPFVASACSALLADRGTAALSETIREIETQWKSELHADDELVARDVSPYSPEEQIALLGRAENDGEFAGRFMTILGDAPGVLLSQQQATYLTQLPKSRRSHVAYAAAALSSCLVFGLCASSSVAALSFCSTAGVECMLGDDMEQAVRRNLSAIDFEIAIAAAQRARALYARRPSAGGPGK